MSNQTLLSSATQASIRAAGKHVMQIMVLQCQSLYATGMTEAAFIEAVYGDIAANNRTAEGVNFFKQVYTHLSANRTVPEVENSETGIVTLALYQKLIDLSSVSPKSNQNNTIGAIVENGDNDGYSTSIWLLLLILALLLILMQADTNQEEE